MGINKKVELSLYDALVNQDVNIKETIKKTNHITLDLCPSNISLAGAEVELVPLMSRETRLKQQLETLKDEYDYMLIDCPPSLGLITINALTAADSILIPIQCEFFALEGVEQLIRTIGIVKRNLNSKLQIEGAVLTMYSAVTNLSNNVVKDVQKNFGDKVFKTIIPRNVKIGEAPSYGMAITEYDEKSAGSIAYQKLGEELIERNSKQYTKEGEDKWLKIQDLEKD